MKLLLLLIVLGLTTEMEGKSILLKPLCTTDTGSRRPEQNPPWVLVFIALEGILPASKQMKKATEFFQGMEPVTHTKVIFTVIKEIKIIKKDYGFIWEVMTIYSIYFTWRV